MTTKQEAYDKAYAYAKACGLSEEGAKHYAEEVVAGETFKE